MSKQASTRRSYKHAAGLLWSSRYWGVQACLAICILGSNLAAGQEPSERNSQPRTKLPELELDNDPPDGDEDVLPKLTDDQIAQANQWIDELSSKSFAIRERAADGLLNLGQAVVPQLRQRAKEADLELRARAESLIRELNDGDLQSKVNAFLKGEDVPFDGWPIFRIMFGSGDKSRSVFIDLLKNYPDLVNSFSGKARDRAIAMQSIIPTIDTKLRSRSGELTIADGIAMLLPVSDDQVPLSPVYERRMMSFLQMNPISRLSKDREIGKPFVGLLNSWIERSTLENRVSVFAYALQADLYTAYPVAIETLEKTRNTITIAMALQVIARFGRKEDVILIEPLLDDPRILIPPIPGRPPGPTMEDAAIAAIAVLHKVPLTELGYDPAAEHHKHGFIYDSLNFQDFETPIGEQRTKARARIDILVKESIEAFKANEAGELR